MEIMEMSLLFNGVFKNKKVLVTGDSGFKGSWLTMWLIELGADVVGLSKDIPTEPSMFHVLGLENYIRHYEVDIRGIDIVQKIINEEQPDFLFHLAAQPIVAKSYTDPIETMETNIMGTLHVLEALRKCNKKCVAVFITSDKCYDNVEWIWGYRESDQLGGKDPYSASKGAAELMIRTYQHSYFNKPTSNIRSCSVRAGNVIGGGDWAENRIVPDCMRAWADQEIVKIRNPFATRPWQHVLEPLSGYLLAAQGLSENKNGINGEPFNFGPDGDQDKTVVELINRLSNYWEGSGSQSYLLEGEMHFHEAGLLKLNCDKALNILHWKPILKFEETSSLTSKWYRNYYEGDLDMLTFSKEQLNNYINLATQRNSVWCNQ